MIKARYVWIIIIIIVLGLFGLWWCQLMVRTITESNISEANPQSHYEVDVKFPQIKGGSPWITSKVNRALASHVSREVKIFKEDLASFRPLPDVATSTLTGRYDLVMLSPERLSVEFDYLRDVAGAAHPFNYVTVFNYDFKKNHQLVLADIIGTSTAALNKLADYAQADLTKQFNEDSLATWIDEGAKPIPENYKNFLLTADSLIILFEPYQVAPYAAGLVRVKIPWTYLDDI